VNSYRLKCQAELDLAANSQKAVRRVTLTAAAVPVTVACLRWQESYGALNC
jgi:hypothetical protein